MDSSGAGETEDLQSLGQKGAALTVRLEDWHSQAKECQMWTPFYRMSE